jgi:pimeloyl-ACP methyl ester carboxylesterase
MMKKKLDDAERSRLPGSFVRLTHGFVHYELSGPPEGPALLLVPGLSVPYSTWSRNSGALAEAGYRVLRYEHYGRGYSDRPVLSYDLKLYVDQIEELVSALGLGRPLALVGLSMGGAVAAATAVRHPGIARALILVDPLFEWPEQGPGSRLLAAPFLGDLAMALLGDRLLAGGQRGDFLDEASFREFLPSYMPSLAYRGIGRAVLSTMRSIPSWPLSRTYAGLGRSGLPLLLIWGREDATLPFAQSERLLAALPGAEFRPIEGAGHVPQWEKAGEVNEAILGFLRTHGDTIS